MHPAIGGEELLIGFRIFIVSLAYIHASYLYLSRGIEGGAFFAYDAYFHGAEGLATAPGYPAFVVFVADKGAALGHPIPYC